MFVKHLLLLLFVFHYLYYLPQANVLDLFCTYYIHWQYSKIMRKATIGCCPRWYCCFNAEDSFKIEVESALRENHKIYRSTWNKDRFIYTSHMIKLGEFYLTWMLKKIKWLSLNLHVSDLIEGQHKEKIKQKLEIKYKN